MAYFSDNEIDEAKRRVRDMQSRAERYAEAAEKNNTAERETKENKEKDAETGTRSETAEEEKEKSPSLPNGEKDESQFIILALVMLLSREGADNMLILALLYLLF